MVQAIHTAVKRRIRYKVEGLYRSESLKQAIEQSLTRREGINRISVNTLTGTVLIALSVSIRGGMSWINQRTMFSIN